MGFQAKSGDIVISCHGGIVPPGTGCKPFTVPEFVEVWLLAPPGAVVHEETAKMVERGEFIEGLEIRSPVDERAGTLPLQPFPHEPSIYKAGDELPPITVAPDSSHVQGVLGGPNIVFPFEASNLADIWEIMVGAFCIQAKDRKKTVRIFLPACMGHSRSLGGGWRRSKRVFATNQPSQAGVVRKP